jgi:hypothetical protein
VLRKAEHEDRRLLEQVILCSHHPPSLNYCAPELFYMGEKTKQESLIQWPLFFVFFFPCLAVFEESAGLLNCKWKDKAGSDKKG